MGTNSRFPQDHERGAIAITQSATNSKRDKKEIITKECGPVSPHTQSRFYLRCRSAASAPKGEKKKTSYARFQPHKQGDPANNCRRKRPICQEQNG